MVKLRANFQEYAMGQVVGNQDGVGYRTVEAVASVNEDGQIIGSSAAPVQVAATTSLPTSSTVIDSTGQSFNPDSCAHTYGYSAGLLATDTATDGTTSWVKTYSYTSGNLTGETKWVRQ